MIDNLVMAYADVDITFRRWDITVEVCELIDLFQNIAT